MALTAIKCPACGAELALDEGKDACFCAFCGTRVERDKLRVEVKSDHSEEISNALRLAEEAFGYRKFAEAYDLYTRVLLLDGSLPEAIFRRALCTGYLAVGSLHVQELLDGFSRADSLLKARFDEKARCANARELAEYAGSLLPGNPPRYFEDKARCGGWTDRLETAAALGEQLYDVIPRELTEEKRLLLEKEKPLPELLEKTVVYNETVIDDGKQKTLHHSVPPTAQRKALAARLRERYIREDLFFTVWDKHRREGMTAAAAEDRTRQILVFYEKDKLFAAMQRKRLTKWSWILTLPWLLLSVCLTTVHPLCLLLLLPVLGMRAAFVFTYSQRYGFCKSPGSWLEASEKAERFAPLIPEATDSKGKPAGKPLPDFDLKRLAGWWLLPPITGLVRVRQVKGTFKKLLRIILWSLVLLLWLGLIGLAVWGVVRLCMGYPQPLIQYQAPV